MAVHHDSSGQPRCLGALCAFLDKLNELVPWYAIVLADLEGLDRTSIDQGVGFVTAYRQGVGDVLHAEDKGHGFKGCVRHSDPPSCYVLVIIHALEG